jgi:hypothetical protein
MPQLTWRGLQISMTEELHCYENAMAEWVNGILKQEYCVCQNGADYNSHRIVFIVFDSSHIEFVEIGIGVVFS